MLMKNEKGSSRRKAAEEGKGSSTFPKIQSINEETEKWKREHPLPDDRARDIFKRFLKK